MLNAFIWYPHMIIFWKKKTKWFYYNSTMPWILDFFRVWLIELLELGHEGSTIDKFCNPPKLLWAEYSKCESINQAICRSLLRSMLRVQIIHWTHLRWYPCMRCKQACNWSRKFNWLNLQFAINYLPLPANVPTFIDANTPEYRKPRWHSAQLLL